MRIIFKFLIIIAITLYSCLPSFAVEVTVPQGDKKEILRLPEREDLVYTIKWLGVPVGTARASINGIKKINGRDAYELIITAKTNEFCSRIYNVDDSYISYMDVKELYTLRHETYRKEGHYKKDSITNFDQVNHKAYFKHLVNKSEKVIDLPPGTQDPVSMAYYFRLVPIRVGEKKEFFVYNNESVYNFYVVIDKKVFKSFPYVGMKEAFHIQPYAKLKGEVVRKGKAHGYFSCEKWRVPLMAIVRGPVFTQVVGYLVKEK